ncbi:hypothetical protein HYV86_06675 [Candidatus Woesearchaeota archaeon]|nr:hypothetical protein [Candidatus Woesearchaeota archaeon]
MVTRQHKQVLRQVVVITFLLLIVVGFTAPLILYSNDDPFAKKSTATQPRLCRSDADCSLSCDSSQTPLAVLCLQNYCMQNSCEEYNPYSYELVPIDLSLKASINGQEVNWNAVPGDSFVTLNNATTFPVVSVFTTGLTLADITSKLGLYMNQDCLFHAGVEYCSNENANLTVYINGNKSVSAERYIPIFGDKVEIAYE